MTQKLKKVIYLICTFLLLGASFYLMTKIEPNIKANDSTQIIGLSQERIILKGKELIKYSLFTKKILVLPGFENNIEVCNFENADLLRKRNILCLSGDVGAHSQNLVMVDISNFKIIGFKENESLASHSIFSDLPKFSASERDGLLLVDIFYRNYDKNPLTDQIKETYKLKDGCFILTKWPN